MGKIKRISKNKVNRYQQENHRESQSGIVDDTLADILSGTLSKLESASLALLTMGSIIFCIGEDFHFDIVETSLLNHTLHFLLCKSLFSETN